MTPLASREYNNLLEKAFIEYTCTIYGWAVCVCVLTTSTYSIIGGNNLCVNYPMQFLCLWPKHHECLWGMSWCIRPLTQKIALNLN